MKIVIVRYYVGAGRQYFRRMAVERWTQKTVVKTTPNRSNATRFSSKEAETIVFNLQAEGLDSLVVEA